MQRKYSKFQTIQESLQNILDNVKWRKLKLISKGMSNSETMLVEEKKNGPTPVEIVSGNVNTTTRLSHKTIETQNDWSSQNKALLIGSSIHKGVYFRGLNSAVVISMNIGADLERIFSSYFLIQLIGNQKTLI